VYREKTVKVKPLTPLWTGDADRKRETLRETGIIGSLRWWYEALIRGLGGTACDPTDTKCDDKSHCDACELFGCTGWGRKFRLNVYNEGDYIKFSFIELRKIKDIEWALLHKTLEIISKYGALGGKIAEESYGLINIMENDISNYSINKGELKSYFKKSGKGVDYPNIGRFVFSNEHLKSSIIKELKNKLSFLKGKRTPSKAKRYFYKKCDAKPFRFFAYAENKEEYAEIKQFFENKKVSFIEGGKLLEGFK
jgi:CRISPR-associated protein Cmr1